MTAQEALERLLEAKEVIKEFCQKEDCMFADCSKCQYPLSVIRCGDEEEYKQKLKQGEKRGKIN